MYENDSSNHLGPSVGYKYGSHCSRSGNVAKLLCVCILPRVGKRSKGMVLFAVPYPDLGHRRILFKSLDHSAMYPLLSPT